MIALAKFQIELALASPVRTFLILFLGLTFVGPVLASLLVHPLSRDQWLRHESEIALWTVLCTLLVWLHRSSPWLGWFGAFGVLAQVSLGLLFVYAPIGASLGFLHPDSTSQFTQFPFTAYATAWAVLALVCAWGMVKDDWRAYFGEIAVILLILAAVYLYPDLSSSADHVRRPAMFAFEEAIRPYMDWVENVIGWLALATLLWTLYRRGRERFGVHHSLGHSH